MNFVDACRSAHCVVVVPLVGFSVLFVLFACFCRSALDVLSDFLFQNFFLGLYTCVIVFDLQLFVLAECSSCTDCYFCSGARFSCTLCLFNCRFELICSQKSAVPRV